MLELLDCQIVGLDYPGNTIGIHVLGNNYANHQLQTNGFLLLIVNLSWVSDDVCKHNTSNSRSLFTWRWQQNPKRYISVFTLYALLNTVIQYVDQYAYTS